MKGEIHPLFDLSGRVALVTGGGSGLGREFCEVLAEFGADVVCNAMHQERADETCGIIKKYGHKTLAIVADVSQYDRVQAMFQQIEDSFGRLDILVNNAGVPTIAPAEIHNLDVKEWHRVIGVNLHGVFYCMKEGLRLMMKQKRGSIINISSVTGVEACDPDIGRPSPYVAAKSALIGLTKQGAAEYGKHGIRVNCIAPGWHLGTRLGERGRKRTPEEIEAFRQILAARTPLKRTGEPRELKGLLLYLASDASSFVTGQTIVHDGGWTIW